MLPWEGYVLLVIARRILQTLQAHKLNMIKREKLARHPRTTWRIWACDVRPGGGGVLPIWWVIHMCRGFGYQTLSFWGIFFSSTNTKTIFWVQILTKFDLFGPKIPFSPRSSWVQFSVAHGTPPAIFGPSTPPPGDVRHADFENTARCQIYL